MNIALLLWLLCVGVSGGMLVLLCCWRPHDAAELPAAYCKGAAPRAGERVHMDVVVALLHLTIVCQHMLCGLYWGYTKTTTPELAEDCFFVLGVIAPVVATEYTVCSPLGNDD